jgi:hypothetical protein
MRAEEIVEQCLRETSARRVSKHAREVCLVALMVVPEGAIGMREYRWRIKETFLKSNPEYGSFFVLIILPILVSLISTWISRWIFSSPPMKKIRAEAFDSLLESSPRWTGTLTSTNSPQAKQTER